MSQKIDSEVNMSFKENRSKRAHFDEEAETRSQASNASVNPIHTMLLREVKPSKERASSFLGNFHGKEAGYSHPKPKDCHDDVMRRAPYGTKRQSLLSAACFGIIGALFVPDKRIYRDSLATLPSLQSSSVK